MKAASQIGQDRAGRSRRAGILLALTIAGVALLVQAVPSLAGSLQWSRQASAPSRTWRWLTGHLTHWSWNHLLWDLIAFAMLSFMGLRFAPRGFTRCLALAAVVIPLELRFHEPQIGSYRGLSGIDSALFGLLVASLWSHRAGSSRISGPRLLAAIGGCCFLAKTLFELITGGTVFVANEQREFVPVVSAHLTGFLSGVLASSGRIEARDPGIRRRPLLLRFAPRLAACGFVTRRHDRTFPTLSPACPTGSTRSSWASLKASPSSSRSHRRRIS